MPLEGPQVSVPGFVFHKEHEYIWFRGGDQNGF